MSGRSGSAPTGDDDVAGSNAGGSPATGGVGGFPGGRASGGRGAAPTGGMAGSGGPPFDPGGPIPNCRADSPVTVPPKDIHWIYLEARLSAQDPEGRYLVELTPNGPENVLYLSEQGAARGWSADGRFLAFVKSGPPYFIELLDFSQGVLPVAVQVPPREGTLTWSHSDGRYALVTDATSTDPSRLVIVEATTAAEKVTDLPAVNFRFGAWSWDDRHIVLVGDGGLALVDTSGAELELSVVYDMPASDARFSPDNRYVAFMSFRPRQPQRDRLLNVFDTQSGTLEVLDDNEWYVGLSFVWAGNTGLIVTIDDDESLFFDVSAPDSPVLLAAHRDEGGDGVVSPDGKCFVFDGYCEAAREVGICVKTLPPDPQKPGVLLQRTDGNFWAKAWSGTGDQLLLESSAEPWLVNIELDGGDYTRRVIAEETVTSNVDRVLGWNPSGSSNWIAYSASPSPGTENVLFDHPRLWNHATGGTFDVPIGTGDMQGSVWSRDGRYLFVESGSTLGNNVYYVQEVRDGELGGLWRLEEPIAAVGSTLWSFNLQP
jgi:hypothetical protein